MNKNNTDFLLQWSFITIKFYYKHFLPVIGIKMITSCFIMFN